MYRLMCNQQVQIFLDICNEINFPYSVEKTYWACTCLVFLGLLIDSQLQLICIPIEKITKAINLINQMLERKSKKTTLLELQQLAGYLNFLCKAIIPGRPFVRRLYMAGKGLTKPNHHTKITRGIKLDLQMWLEFLQFPNIYCRPFVDFDEAVLATEVNFFTDASRNFKLGAGGICHNSWFSVRWDLQFMEKTQPSIEYLELYAVLVGAYNWIHRFANRCIIIFCDNISVVYMINRNTSSCKQCLMLIRRLVLLSMKHNVRVMANYVSSKNNKLADLLSRMKIRGFKKLSPQADKNPTLLHDDLWPMYKVWDFTA